MCGKKGGRRRRNKCKSLSLFFCLELACLVVRVDSSCATKRDETTWLLLFFFFFFFLQRARLSGILLIKSSLAGGVKLRLKVYVTALQKEESVHAAGAREQHSRGYSGRESAGGRHGLVKKKKKKRKRSVEGS